MSRGGRGAPPGCVNYGDAAVGGGMKLPGAEDVRSSGTGESGLWPAEELDVPPGRGGEAGARIPAGGARIRVDGFEIGWCRVACAAACYGLRIRRREIGRSKGMTGGRKAGRRKADGIEGGRRACRRR